METQAITAEIEEVQQLIQQVKNEADFKTVIQQLLKMFKCIKFTKQNLTYIDMILGPLFSQILSLDIETDFALVDFYEFILDNNLVPLIHKKFVMDKIRLYFEKYLMTKIEEKPITSKKQDLVKNLNIQNLLKENFKKALTIEGQENDDDSSIDNKRSGFSIIDINGDLIWADKLTQKYWEINKKKKTIVNFFSLLIPQSQKEIANYFGYINKDCTCFFDEQNYQDKLKFQYTIYSSKSRNKFLVKFQEKLSKLKKNQRIQKVQFLEKINRNKDQIYFKYLKSFKSEAQLKFIDLNDEKTKDLFEKKKFQIKKNKRIKKNLQNPLSGFQNLQLVILLKTNYAEEIPEFDNEVLLQDPKIQKFEKFVREKINI